MRGACAPIPTRRPTVCVPCWRRGAGRWPGRGGAPKAVTALRKAFGHRRAEIVGAAMMPETGKTGSTAEPAGKRVEKKPRGKPERERADRGEPF